jgi:hypothetical protein
MTQKVKADVLHSSCLYPRKRASDAHRVPWQSTHCGEDKYSATTKIGSKLNMCMFIMFSLLVCVIIYCNLL